MPLPLRTIRLLSFLLFSAPQVLPASPVAFREIPLESKEIKPFLKDLSYRPEWYRDSPAVSPLEAATEKRPLTPADVVGPDGVVYPDFSRAGVPGGIPQVPVAVRLSDTGLKPGQDLRAPLLRAIENVSAKGGGAILIPEGTFTLDRPLTITNPGVVIRGSGREKTFIEYRGALARRELRWVEPDVDDAEIALNRTGALEGWFDCDDWVEARFLVDGKVVYNLKYWNLVTGQGRLATYGTVLERAGVKAGNAVLTLEVQWKDGTTSHVDRPVRFTTGGPDRGLVQVERAMIEWKGFGSGAEDLPIPLTRDGRRGEMEVDLGPSRGPLAVGDFAVLEASPSAGFLKMIRSSNRTVVRRQVFQVVGILGSTVRLNQPLRIDFPKDEPTTFRRIGMVTGMGLEDLTLDGRNARGRIWHSGLSGVYVANSWARRVAILKPGRNPLAFSYAKWVQVEDAAFEDAWFKDGGGTAYVFWQNSYDCLMERVTGRLLRHAPNFQWSASGCVIRESVFEDSDAQFHAGYPHENLVEHCVIESRKGNGSYGFGLYVQEAESTSHGPQGPRNVLYQNDIRAAKPAIWIGGNTHGYVFAYNRLVTGSGPVIFAKAGSFGHVVIGNDLVGLDPGPFGGIFLGTPDCTGWRVEGNRFFGPMEAFITGAVNASQVAANPWFVEAPPTALPKAPVPSLFLWQKAQREKGSTAK